MDHLAIAKDLIQNKNLLNDQLRELIRTATHFCEGKTVVYLSKALSNLELEVQKLLVEIEETKQLNPLAQPTVYMDDDDG